jgi:hypothetical protein
MSSLMDPDGANRIIKQQISEWHAERREDANARLLEREPRGRRWAFPTRVRELFASMARVPSLLVKRLRRAPVTSLPEIAKGHLPR